MANNEKKGMSTNSNTYTLIYASVIVVIVAFLLAFVSSSLKEKQDANVKVDTMKQILSAVGVQSDDTQAEFTKNVKDMLLNEDGSLSENTGDFATTYAKEFKEGRKHVFVANVNGETKYIFPLTGNGLWGAIWGYIAVNADKNTIFGTSLSHASETPGLGAEITTDAFKKQFVGKKVIGAGEVAITVVKNGNAKDTNFEVDGISGGTLTSNGVAAMLKTSLSEYKSFFNN